MLIRWLLALLLTIMAAVSPAGATGSASAGTAKHCCCKTDEQSVKEDSCSCTSNSCCTDEAPAAAILGVGFQLSWHPEPSHFRLKISAAHYKQIFFSYREHLHPLHLAMQ